MLALIILSAYLLIGLYFRPYSLGWPLISSAIAHVLWLPALLLAVIVMRFSPKI